MSNEVGTDRWLSLWPADGIHGARNTDGYATEFSLTQSWLEWLGLATAWSLHFYDRYAPAIYALAAHLLNPTDAEEVVQEVFLRLWNKADRFDAQSGSFKAWFMTVARNHIWDLLKQRTNEQRLLATYEIEQRLSDPIDPATHLSETTWSGERQAAMLNALQDLPAEQKRAIVMAYFGGFSQSAIAQELGWPLGTVKKRIRLGLQKLRHFLGQWQGSG